MHFKNVVGSGSKEKTWIIFKITTCDKGNAKAGETFIFYVNDINSFGEEWEFEFPRMAHGIFYGVECYSIEIMAANTENVKNVMCMFYWTKSHLEQDKDSPSVLIGLDRLNMRCVDYLSYMFCSALYKQSTLDSLAVGRFNASNVWARAPFRCKPWIL